MQNIKKLIKSFDHCADVPNDGVSSSSLEQQPTGWSDRLTAWLKLAYTLVDLELTADGLEIDFSWLMHMFNGFLHFGSAFSSMMNPSVDEKKQYGVMLVSVVCREARGSGGVVVCSTLS